MSVVYIFKIAAPLSVGGQQSRSPSFFPIENRAQLQPLPQQLIIPHYSLKVLSKVT
jgi:hypothetical protein